MSVLLAIGFAKCEEYQTVVSDARMVLESEGSLPCCESHTKSSDVIVYRKEDDTFPQSRGACHDAFATDYNRTVVGPQ
jgi:hypothetical protein